MWVRFLLDVDICVYTKYIRSRYVSLLLSPLYHGEHENPMQRNYDEDMTKLSILIYTSYVCTLLYLSYISLKCLSIYKREIKSYYIKKKKHLIHINEINWLAIKIFITFDRRVSEILIDI